MVTFTQHVGKYKVHKLHCRYILKHSVNSNKKKIKQTKKTYRQTAYWNITITSFI